MKDAIKKACGFVCAMAFAFAAFVAISTIVYG